MDKLITLIAGLVVIVLVVWWFFGKRQSQAVVAEIKGDRQVVEVVVDGGYKPAVVELKSGVPADIIFMRKDASACFEEVVLPDFGIRAKLPVNEPYKITVNPDAAGEYKYACGMNMFFGKVIVK